MNKLLDKLLEMWISIPRIWRMSFLTAFVAVLILYWIVKGYITIINHFAGLSLSTIIVAFIAAFIMLVIFNKNSNNK